MRTSASPGRPGLAAGALSAKWTDRANPLDRFVQVMNEEQGFSQAPPAAQMFGGAGREYRWKHGTKRETFAKISEKARKHAAKNPYALFRDLLSVDEILARALGTSGVAAVRVVEPPGREARLESPEQVHGQGCRSGAFRRDLSG